MYNSSDFDVHSCHVSSTRSCKLPVVYIPRVCGEIRKHHNHLNSLGWCNSTYPHLLMLVFFNFPICSVLTNHPILARTTVQHAHQVLEDICPPREISKSL